MLNLAGTMQYSGSNLTGTGTAIPAALGTLAFADLPAITKFLTANSTNVAHLLEIANRSPESEFRIELSAAAITSGNGFAYEKLYVVTPWSLDGNKSLVLEPIADITYTFTHALGSMAGIPGARTNHRAPTAVVVVDKGRVAARSGYTIRGADQDAGASAGHAFVNVYDPGQAIAFVRHIVRGTNLSEHVGLHRWWR